MDIYKLFAIIMTLAASIGYLNARFLRMPTTIAIMSGSLLVSLVVIIGGKYGFAEARHVIGIELSSINFHRLLMEGMLSFLLFAGALEVDIHHLYARRYEILTLATFSTVTSTFLIGGIVYYLLQFTHFPMPFIYCLLFGALISPTDPIAVLAIFKQVGANEKLKVTVTGESLFNDGVAIVLFLTLYQVAFMGIPATTSNILTLFIEQAIGGIAYGLLLGWLAHYLLKPLDNYKVEIMISLSVVTGGYFLAELLHVSGPLAMVVAGIYLGNRGRKDALSAKIHKHLDDFWEMVDEILNAVLFSLLGLELLVLDLDAHQIIISVLAIVLVLAIRFFTVALPIAIFKRYKSYVPYFTSILVWGGLRGGLAVALALSLPTSPYRSLILSMTYAIVVFAVIVQGLTVKPLVTLSQRKAMDSETQP